MSRQWVLPLATRSEQTLKEEDLSASSALNHLRRLREDRARRITSIAIVAAACDCNSLLEMTMRIFDRLSFRNSKATKRLAEEMENPSQIASGGPGLVSADLF